MGQINLNIYNSVLNQTSATINSDFNLSANTDNQYEWSAPSNYPFTKNAGESFGYNQDLTWLLSYKGTLSPFSGINTPPNPGYNYSAYSEYETGLFGFDRATYTA